jgi:hypothetical protein
MLPPCFGISRLTHREDIHAENTRSLADARKELVQIQEKFTLPQKRNETAL